MKIVEFNKPEPTPIPEPTFEEELRAELEDFGKPKAVVETPIPIVEVDKLEEEIRTQFEAAYSGNLGMMEVIEFYKIASPKIIALFKRLVDAHKDKEAWKLVQKVTSTNLVGQEFHEDDKDSYQPPEIEVGDEVKVGKFKNRKATVTGFDTDKDNQPVLKTNKGEHKLFKPRISKLEEDPMEWERDADHDMLNPIPIVSDDDVYGFMDDVDSELAELIPNRANLVGREYGTALEKIRYKVGTVQEVPINQIIATEKYLVKAQVEAIIAGRAKSSSAMPVLYKQGNTYYAGDGNHRIAATYLTKQNTIRGLVLDAQQIMNEGVGIITKQNQTADVGPNQTKIEAAKLGLTVDKGGIPPLLRTNGKTKKPSSVMEGIRQLDELNMAPGHLQKEVTKILHSAHPRIGLEFEVCFSSSDDESNPDIQSYTSMQDVQDFFTYNEGSDFDDIGNLYQEWLDDKQGEWTNERVEATLNNPTDETYEKKDFMANHYTTSGDADEYLEAMDADEITEELADEVISRADQIYKANGPADEWPQPPEGSDPFILLYYEIFVEDNEEASDYFNEFYMQDFYDSVLASGDDDYSVGTWLKSIHINSMGDVSREFPDTLTWTGGAMYDGEFNLAFAEEVANELTYDLGIEAEVMPEYETGDGPVQYNNWWVTHDPSVNAKEGDTALEIITATMDYEDGIRDIEEFMGYLKDKNAYTNESTGLHINVSMANIDHSNVDYAKLIVMLGDSHILSKFGREFNEYAEHSLVKLGELMDASQGYERDKPGRAKSYATLMSKMKSNLNNVVAEAFKDMPIDKYSSVGLKDDRIEFRSAGGSDYLNNFDQILSLINRFIVAYAVAADPEAHKKEYGKKLYKLASNVGQGQASKSSMTLFAGFGAGIITKEDLIKQLKAKREMARVEPIDTGEFVPKQFDELNADEDIDGQAAEQIAKKWNKSYEAVKRLWNKSLAIEMNSMPPPREPDRNVYNNLMKDIRHYQADELPGLELVVNKYQVSYEKASGLLRHAIGVEMINATDSADANRTALQNILADIGHYE